MVSLFTYQHFDFGFGPINEYNPSLWPLLTIIPKGTQALLKAHISPVEQWVLLKETLRKLLKAMNAL